MKKISLLFSLLCCLLAGGAAVGQTITSFTPLSAKPGDAVTITGTGFNTTATSNIVFFGATRATVTTATATSITATVPTGATYAPITVLNTATMKIASSGANFTPTYAPTKTTLTTADFLAKIDFTTGGQPSSVAIGDLDGDGKPDLAVANTSSISGNSVSVFRNTSTSGSIATSSFATRVNFTTGTGSQPQSVAIGDLDGDGKPDLVTANGGNGANSVSVFHNTSTSGSIGTSSFATKVDFATGTTPVSVAIGDLDGDGKLDLAVANFGTGGNSISVFRNTSTSGSISTSSFATKVDFATGTAPISVAIGDLDGDGKPDLAVANLGTGVNTVSVLRNTSTSGSIGTSSFADKIDFTAGTQPRSIAIGDLDGDGKPDLAVANLTSGNISVLRNTSTSGSIGTNSFADKVDFTTGTTPRSVVIGDLDGDSKPDLVVANTDPNSVSVLRNTSTSGNIGTGSFATKVDFTTGTGPRSAAIGDLDGDGKPDLAVANTGSNSVSVLRNTGVITVTGMPTAFSTCAGVATAEQSFTVSGTHLTANITVTAPTDFEISTTSGSEFGSSIILPQSGGSVVTTTIYVRMPATATGSPSGNVSLASTGATTQNVAVSGTVSACVTCPSGNTLYVNTAVSGGTGDGSTWANAYASLGNALAIAHACSNIKTIKVASGTYKPTKKPFNSGAEITTADGRDLTFHIPDDVTIEGGYNASTDTRDITANVTTLSGDIDNNNILDNGNCYHVVLTATASSNTTSKITIDGFYITGGNANGSSSLTVNASTNTINRNDGGGLSNNSGTNTLMNNTIYSNSASNGGGISTSGTTTLTNNTMYSNSASNGGGISTSGTTTLMNNAIYSNSASGNGGGISTSSGTATLTNNMLHSNSASEGGGIYITNSTITLTNNAIYSNSASSGGGGIHVTFGGGTTITNNTIYRNSAGRGGGIYTTYSANKLTNNTLYSNSASSSGSGGGIYADGNSTNTLTNNIFWQNKKGTNESVVGADYVNISSNNTLKNNLLQLTNDNYTAVNSNALGTSPSGNLFAQDPLFVATTAPINLRLQATSPCINAGISGTGIPTTDIAGATRTGLPDLGAYEYIACTTPTTYSVTGGGSYCIGGTGLAVGLDNSETGVTYQLKKDDTDEEAAQSGTGTALSWANKTVGTYTVVATRTAGGCTATMTGSAVVTANSLPTTTISPITPVSTTATSFSLPYSAVTGSPNQYSIAAGTPTAMPSFTAVSNAILGTSPIAVTIPASAANTYNFNLSVRNSTTGCVSTTVPFTLTVTAPTLTIPTITSFSPLSAKPGDAVTITGTGFNATAANNIVFFGATQATVTAATATSLTATVPSGATYAPISVLNTATVLSAASIARFNPIYAPAKTALTSTDFPAKIDFTTGSFPISVAIGDLDGDGKPDLAVANYSSNTVSVFRNTGTSGSIAAGSFAAKTDFTTGFFPVSVAIGDLDGDGKPDLAVTNQASNSVSVFRNTSTSGSIAAGSFAAKTDFTTENEPSSVAIGDLDSDGKPDLAVANAGLFEDRVSVFRNTGTAAGTVSFANKINFISGDRPFSVAIGDLDGDGKPDLATANIGSNSVSVLRNTSTTGTIATNSFAAKTDFTTENEPRSVAIGDLDGDGKPDLAVTNQASNSVSVFRNTSSSGSIAATSFAAKTDFTTGSNPYSVAIGDLDGDGKPDLAVTNQGSNSVSVFRNTGTSGSIAATSFAAKTDFTTGSNPYSVAIGDVDGDTRPDLATANSGSNSVSVLRNADIAPPTITATGTLTPFQTCSGVPSSVQSFTVNGSNLTGDITVSVASGVQVSKISGSGYGSSVTLTPTNGSVDGTEIFVRLPATTVTSGSTSVSGVINVTSSGATSRTVSFSGSVVPFPSIALGIISSVSTTATSFSIPYTDLISASQYSITTGTPTAMSNFSAVTNEGFPEGSFISVPIPASVAATYNFNLTVRNTTTGCVSANVPFTLTVTAPASTPNITVTAALTPFSTCAGTASAEQSFTVSGADLTANIALTAPAGFEISTTSGSGFQSSLTLTQSGGTVANTTIYVRMAGIITQVPVSVPGVSSAPSDVIIVSSAGATTRTVALNGTVSPASVGGTVDAVPSICSGTAPSNLSLKGATGTVVKWQKSADAAFTSPTDISSTATTLTGAVIGTLTTTTYFRAVVKSGVCPEANSGSVLVTVKPTPTAPTISGNAEICEGETATLSANSTEPVGGTSPAVYLYQWSNSTTGASIQVSPTVTTTYTVTATVDGCTSPASAVFTLTVNPKPAIPTITSSAMQMCKGESVLLTGSCSAVTDIFRWTTPPLLANGVASLGNTNQRTITAPGVYKGLCESNKGCLSAEVSITITERSNCNGLNFITVSPTKPVICPNASVVLTASGCAGGTLTWLGGPATQTGTAVTVSPAATTSYFVQCSTGGSTTVDVAVAQTAVQVANNIVTGQDRVKATDTITSDKKIGDANFTPAPSVIYEAGKSITLLPGFTAEKWSTFKAEIKTCPSSN